MSCFNKMKCGSFPFCKFVISIANLKVSSMWNFKFLRLADESKVVESTTDE